MTDRDPSFAGQISQRSYGQLGDKWHLDEAVISIGGKKHWLWRAIDQDGFVLDVLMQSRRDRSSAKPADAQASKEPGLLICAEN